MYKYPELERADRYIYTRELEALRKGSTNNAEIPFAKPSILKDVI